MGGSKVYGVVTADALRRAKYGGATYTQNTELDMEAVSTALRRAVNNDPLFIDGADRSDVAKRVEDDLEKNGFKDIKVKNGTVSKGGMKFGFSKKNGLWVAVKKNLTV